MREPMPLRLRATPDQITRMEQTLRWAIWVEVNERKLIWHRAARRRSGKQSGWEAWLRLPQQHGAEMVLRSLGKIAQGV